MSGNKKEHTWPIENEKTKFDLSQLDDYRNYEKIFEENKKLGEFWEMGGSSFFSDSDHAVSSVKSYLRQSCNTP